MTIEEIDAKIREVEKIKAECERGRDKALERRMNGNANSASDYLYWVGNVEAAGREIKRLHTEKAELVLHGGEK